MFNLIIKFMEIIMDYSTGLMVGKLECLRVCLEEAVIYSLNCNVNTNVLCVEIPRSILTNFGEHFCKNHLASNVENTKYLVMG